MVLFRCRLCIIILLNIVTEECGGASIVILVEREAFIPSSGRTSYIPSLCIKEKCIGFIGSRSLFISTTSPAKSIHK